MHKFRSLFRRKYPGLDFTYFVALMFTILPKERAYKHQMLSPATKAYFGFVILRSRLRTNVQNYCVEWLLHCCVVRDEIVYVQLLQ